MVNENKEFLFNKTTTKFCRFFAGFNLQMPLFKVFHGDLISRFIPKSVKSAKFNHIKLVERNYKLFRFFISVMMLYVYFPV